MGAEWRSMAYWGVPRRMTADYGASGRIRFFCETPTTLTSCTSRTTRTKTHCFEICWRFVAKFQMVVMVADVATVSKVEMVAMVESVANL